MKNLICTVLLILSSKSYSAINNSISGEFYIGQEMVNELYTGNLCYLYVDQVNKSAKGKHCSEMQVRAIFSTDNNNLPKQGNTLISRITNYHRSEYPQQKTCALSLEGRTDGNDIYADDDLNLYNDILSAALKYNGSQLDLFVSLSPVTKKPVRVRIHKLKYLSEINYDCVNLKSTF